MRKLAGGIAGAFALLFMTIMQPWSGLDCDSSDLLDGQCDVGGLVFYAIALAFYLILPLIVMGIILVAVLGIRGSNQPHDLAVRAAFGETQGSAVRAAASVAFATAPYGWGPPTCSPARHTW